MIEGAGNYQPQVDEALQHSRLYTGESLQAQKSHQKKIESYVLRFVDNLKQLSPTYRFKLFTKRVYSIVADKAADYSFYINNDLLVMKPTKTQKLKYHFRNSPSMLVQVLFKFYSILKRKDLVLNPGGTFICFWELLVLLLSILNIMYIPLSMCFDMDKSDSLLARIFLGYFPSYIFLLDMILSFFKAYYEKGILHNTKTEMFWHYVKGDLMIDLCVVMPFFLEMFGVKNTNYFMLLRATRIKRTFDTIEETFNFQEQSAALFELVYLICFVIMGSHFCACMFHYIAILEKSQGVAYTWLDAQHIQDSDWTTRYINSLYFTAITSMTVGYGDIVPVTDTEKVFVTCITYLVTGVFGYIITSIGSIVGKLRDSKYQSQQQIRIINNIINSRGLTNELQFKVRTYFEYYLRVQQEYQINFEDLMSQMNRNLREEVQIQLYYKYLKKSNFLRNNFSQEFIKSLSFKMKEEMFSPEQNILIKGSTATKKLIIILSGEVLSYELSEDISLKQYNEGKVIGEREFFLKEPVQFCVKAKTFVQTASISEDDFNNILKHYPYDQEKFCFLKDQYHFSEVADYGIACEVCLTNHAFNQCPFSFIHMNKGKCINVVTQTKLHERRHMIRKPRRTRQEAFQIRQQAIRIIIKEAMSNKEYVDQPFHRQYLDKIGFSTEQIKTLKKSLVTSDLRHFMKRHSNHRNSTITHKEVEEIMMQSIDVDDEGGMGEAMLRFNTHHEPLELKTSFDMDRIDTTKRSFYYPEDNIEYVIERITASNILNRLKSIHQGGGGISVASRLLRFFMRKK